MGNSSANADKESTSKNVKTDVERWNMLVQTKKATQPIYTTLGSKPEGTGKRRNNKKISRQDKTMQTKHGISKQRKNSTHELGVEARRHTSNQLYKRTKEFLSRILEPREYNRKAE